MGLIRPAAAVVFSILLSGCLAPRPPSKAKTPAPRPRAVVREAVLDAPLKTSWTETLRRLEKSGFEVESALPQRGMIFTKWKVVRNVKWEYGLRPRQGPAPLAERVRADISMKPRPDGKTSVKVSATVQYLYPRRRRRGDKQPPAAWKTIPSNGKLETTLIAALR